MKMKRIKIMYIISPWFRSIHVTFCHLFQNSTLEELTISHVFNSKSS